MTKREAFETWVKENGAFTDWSRDKTSEANPYHKPLVERTWQAWCAAVEWANRDPLRAALDSQGRVMSKAGKKMIEAAGEALAVTKCSHTLFLLPQTSLATPPIFNRYACTQCSSVFWVPIDPIYGHWEQTDSLGA